MKVVHIITRMIVGGAQENTLYNCLDLIRDYGDDVTLVTGPSEGPEGELLRQGRGVNLKTEVVDSLRRSIHPWRDWKALGELKRVIQKIQPDVVHTHSAKGGILGRMAGWSQKVPVVVHTVHGAPFYPYQNRAIRNFYRMCETYAARRCHKLISVANAMTDLMVEAKVAPREKFQTIYSGMEVEPFLDAQPKRDEVRRRLGFTDNHVVIGKIARLFELKGHEYLVEAAREVTAQNPNVRFLLVGDGVLRTEIEAAIAEHNLQKFFVFTGLVPPSEIPQLVSAMDALVHVSLREGLARALPQALISGKPVVSFDIDGAREVCISNETGFLIAPKDISELTEALLKLADDRQLREQLGSTGQQRFTQQFRHQTMTEQIRELYESILLGNGK